jgi:hypothetical protein
MRVVEVLFTFIFLIGIIYIAIPFGVSVYCFVILPHTHNGDVFVTDAVDEEKEELNNLFQSIPEYTNTSHQPKTLCQLQDTLQVCNPPQPYSQAYDCSNLAAYTEHYLENNGFNTTISASFTEGHAWCSVYNIIGCDIVHVECVPPAHIRQTWGPVEVSYNDIYDALAGDCPHEFVWWCI